MRRFNPKIAVAFIVGLVMVGGSFILSQKTQSTGAETIATIKAEEDGVPAHGFIPVYDADGDGLPDWQDTFNIPTVYIGDEEGEPLTETGALAIQLATLTRTDNTNIESIMSSVGSSVTSGLFDKDYTSADIVIDTDDSLAAKKAYGNAVAAIALKYAPPSGTEGELVVLNKALIRNDPSILAGLDPTIGSYQKMLDEMLETPVPPSLTREHLALINVYQALINDIKAFRLTFEDALPAMTRFRRYQADAEALYTAIVILYQKLDAAGIQWTVQDPASRFVRVG